MAWRLKLALIVLLSSIPAFSQGIRVDSVAQSTAGISGQQVITPLANVTVTVCTAGATGMPCSPQATTYTDGTLGTPCSAGNQVTLTGTSTCVATGDSKGNFGFWVAAGNYKFTVTGAGIIGQLYNLTASLPATGGTISGAVTITGALTTQSINGIQFADQFAGADGGAKITAAIAALPASGGTVFAQGLGAHTWGSNVFPGNKAVDLYLPASTITLNAVQTIPENVNIHCVPSTDTTHGTTFNGTINTGSWFTWTDLFTSTMDGCSFIKTGTAGGTLFSVIGSKFVRLRNFQNINGNWNDILFINSDSVGSAIYNDFEDFFATGFVNNFIHLTSTGGATKVVTDNYFRNMVDLGTTGNTCILFDSGATSPIGENIFDNGDCTANTTGLNINTNQARDNQFRGMFFENSIGTGVNIIAGVVNTTFIGTQVTANSVNVADSGSTVWLGNVAGVFRQFTVTPAGDTNFNSIGIGAAGSSNVGGINLVTGNCVAVSGGNSLCFANAGPFLPGTKNFSLATGGLTVPESTAVSGAAANDVCYADSTLHALKCSYNNGTFFQIPQVITATSAGFATATTAGTCVQNVTAVTGAATTMAVAISPVSTPGVGAVWAAFVSSAGNVTINECAVATSAGGTIAFNIRVFP